MDTHEQLEANVVSIRDTIESLASLDASLIDTDEIEECDENDNSEHDAGCSHDAIREWVVFCAENGYDPTDDIDETIEQWISETPLDAYETGKRQLGGDWDADGYVVVFCTGGPHIEVKDGRVEGCWGSARASRGLSSDASDWLEDRMFGAYR